MKVELTQKTTQTLAITQQMEQSIKILEMDTPELLEYLQALSLENPVMDLDAEPTEAADRAAMRKKLEWLDALSKNDRQNVGYYEDNSATIEKMAALDFHTLDAYLMEQASLACEKALLPAVTYVIGVLDEDGYLRVPMEELLEWDECDQGKMERAISYVQSLEPAGVGARDLVECLLLQLPAQDSIARRIAEKHLDDLAKCRIPQLAKLLGVSKEEVEQAALRIRALNPKPGSGFDSPNSPSYVTPDVIVTACDGTCHVLPCESSYPALNLSASYISLMRQAGDEEVETYIDKKIKQVQWVQKCIQNRTETLLSVAEAIVRYQERFFCDGPQHMAVLRMSDVAGALDIHESTVSRAVKNKYLQCAHGTFPLKYFFVQGTRSANSVVSESSHEFKAKIRDLIENEDKKNPLSDQEIVQILEGRNSHISRRTVTKYREQMQIPKSYYRRA